MAKQDIRIPTYTSEFKHLQVDGFDAEAIHTYMNARVEEEKRFVKDKHLPPKAVDEFLRTKFILRPHWFGGSKKREPAVKYRFNSGKDPSMHHGQNLVEINMHEDQALQPEVVRGAFIKGTELALYSNLPLDIETAKAQQKAEWTKLGAAAALGTGIATFATGHELVGTGLLISGTVLGAYGFHKDSEIKKVTVDSNIDQYGPHFPEHPITFSRK